VSGAVSNTASNTASSAALSAKGTRLNRRGLQTRRHLLEVAVRCLASGGPEAVSANLVAKEAGATWGVVQHQFGDVDGLWASVLEHIAAEFEPMTPVPADGLAERVRAIIDVLWEAVDLPGSHAIRNLRLALPRETAAAEVSFPRTAAAIASWEAQWRSGCERAFEGLPVDHHKLRRVVALLPGAMMGLRDEQHLVTYVDVDEARRGLSEAVTAYLS
jgi:AcrR family transcriptional regulator